MRPLDFYHHLPYFAKEAAASVRGIQLRWQRYNSQTDELVAQALERETWSAKRWKDWQAEHLTRVLWHAVRRVPYYQQQWADRRRQGDSSSAEMLENWPLLSKETVRSNPKAFLADRVNLRSQIVEHTSGTTGKPVTLWMSRNAVRQWYALFEARWRGWYGISRRDRWGILGGQLVASFAQATPPYWVWNASLHQLYFSSYHITPRNTSDYINAIRDHKLVYLLGYASSLYSLAQLALEQNLPIPPQRIVISNAEPLYAHQREIISQAFQCPVVDTYGLSENICAASECNQGKLHLWPEVGVIEIFKDTVDQPATPGMVGRIIATGLLNPTMPLIRYQVGDRSAMYGEDQHCACGRNMPILSSIEGRMDDVILTTDGRRIGRLDPVFKSDLHVREAQIIQESRGVLRVKIVPAPEFNNQNGEEIIQRLQDRVGSMKILLEKVESIPRSANGKFRAVVSKIDSK